MDIIEGAVVFRNLTGRQALVKVEALQSPTFTTTLHFSEAALGGDFVRVRSLPLGEVIRVEVGPEAQGHSGPRRPVIRFID